MVRTRFAPSPTGSLHVGNVRLAVLNWLFARHANGAFVLRIEDTDEERNQEGSESEILEDLAWLGLIWDEGPAQIGHRGELGPYRQSERGALYRDHAERLIASGHAFLCYCTEEELETKRQAALARGDRPVYDGACRRRSAEEIESLVAQGRKPAIRFHVADGPDVLVRDIVRGDVYFARAEIGDFIILRSDGEPTYNFAVVVDDELMKITHVVRGVGHLSNTPRQVLLFEAFGFDVPHFAHVPQVLGPDRQKLSKRHGAKPIAQYRREGYHPDGVVNYLSLLSWSSPTGEEVLTREQLIAEISLERIGVADVVFDPAKLDFLSAKHIDRMSLDALLEAVTPFVDRSRYALSAEQLRVALEAVRTHLVAFSQINDLLAPFVPRTGAQASVPASAAVLRATHAALRDAPWEPSAISTAIRAAGKESGVGGKALFEPIRIALTGEAHGPPLPAVIFVHGRAAVLDALAAAAGTD